MKYWKIVADKLQCCWLVMGVIAVPLPQTAGVDAHREGRRYIVHSDVLLSAFL
jgi:hypothetical protein